MTPKAIRRTSAASQAANTADATVPAPAAGTILMTDKRGRYLLIRDEMPARQRIHLKGMMGPLASIPDVMNEVTMVCSVIEIDGEPQRFPQNRRELDAQIDRVENDGILAALRGKLKLNGIETDENGVPLSPEAIPQTESIKDRAKN
ncbi:MAG: hypothetical protein JSR89_18315 [Proteobacteria bacterium]|nr:hypothetical protein [Pseudomonadota bacterium]